MEATYVNVDESYLGKIVAQDIFANTQNPIVTINSIITPELLHVFKVFNISKVLVLKDDKIDHEKKNQESIDSQSIEIIEDTFRKHYEEAVTQFKKEFSRWQSLAKVDIVKIRGIILPLVEEILNDRTILFDLNQYSNPKDYIYHHCIATGLISSVIAQKLGLEKGIMLQIAIAGTLADSGMSKISSNILEKKGSFKSKGIYGNLETHCL